MPSSANRPENGGISFRVPEEAQGWRLDKALGLLLASPSPEQEAARPDLFALADLGLRARRRLCDRSLVLVNGKPGIPGLKLRAGQEIIILPDPEGAALPEDAPSLVYKDGGIAALYKPAGMHTAALAGSLSPSLETLLGDLLPSEEEGYASRLLNRLDAPTSGLVLASCTDDGERRWYRAERIGNTDKLYLALIEGQPPAVQGLPGGVPVFRGLRLPEDAPEVGVVLRKQVQHPAAQAPLPQAGHGAQVVQQGKGTARLQPNQGVGDQILPVVQAQGLVASLLHEGEHGAQGLELLWGKGGGQLLTVQLGQLLWGELIQLHGVQTPLS